MPDQIVGALITQRFSDVGIDVREHVVDRVLGNAIDALSFWDEVADELVEAFAFGLVGGPVGVGEEGGAKFFPVLAGLDPEKSGEFESVVA